MLYFPAIGAVDVSMRLKRAQSVASSPFTYSQQVYEHQGTCWEMEYTMPPLTYTEAREVEAFILRLRGRAGTFAAGHPLHTSSAVVHLSSAVSERDTNISCVGSEVFAGTYFQLGSYLYMCTEYFSGTGAMQIEPPIRESLTLEDSVDYGLVTDTDTSEEDYGWVFEADSESDCYGLVSDNNHRALNFSSPKSLWRMSTADTGWSVNTAQIQSFTFSFSEAL